jgi:hypothetical protein
VHVLDHVHPKDLIAGLHVGESGVIEHVRGESEHPVADVVPEVESARNLPSGHPRTVDRIGASLNNGFDQFGILARIILKIGVLNQHDIAGHIGESRAQGCPLSHVLTVKVDFVLRSLRELLEQFPGTITRTVVDDDQFLLGSAKLRRFYTRDNLANRPDLVINRHQN